MWAVHGGGFYNPQKYLDAPPQLPRHLHWFYWESYSTWLTGFALFTVLYLFNAGTFLIFAYIAGWNIPGRTAIRSPGSVCAVRARAAIAATTPNAITPDNRSRAGAALHATMTRSVQ